MTLIAAINIRKFQGLPINEILLAGDSRVFKDIPPTNQNSKKRNSNSFFEAHFDSAQKIIPVAPNVLLGFAGDYKVIKLVKELNAFLSKPDPSNKEWYKRSIGILKNEIRRFITESYHKSNFTETDFLFVIKDFKTNVKRLYKLMMPNDIFVSLEEGIHVIGDSAKTRADFVQNYEYNKSEILKYNQGKDIISILSVTLGATLENVKSEGVGGRFHCFLMNNNGWVNIGTAQLYDEANTAVATAMGDYGISTQINGIDVELLTNDWSTVDNHLKKQTKSVLRYEKISDEKEPPLI